MVAALGTMSRCQVDAGYAATARWAPRGGVIGLRGRFKQRRSGYRNDVNNFVIDIAAIQERARANFEAGAVTDAYGADSARVVEVLNDALATELAKKVASTLLRLAVTIPDKDERKAVWNWAIKDGCPIRSGRQQTSRNRCQWKCHRLRVRQCVSAKAQDRCRQQRDGVFLRREQQHRRAGSLHAGVQEHMIVCCIPMHVEHFPVKKVG